MLMFRIWIRRIVFTPIIAYVSLIWYPIWWILGGHDEASSVIKFMWKQIWFAEDLEHK